MALLLAPSGCRNDRYDSYAELIAGQRQQGFVLLGRFDDA